MPLSKLIAFLTVGALTALVNFSLFNFFWAFCHINYKTAVTISYFLGASFQFWANRTITFKSTANNVLIQAIKFCGLLGFNYLITISVVSFLVERLHFTPPLSVIISIGMNAMTGFLVSNSWVFKNKSFQLERN